MNWQINMNHNKITNFCVSQVSFNDIKYSYSHVLAAKEKQYCISYGIKGSSTPVKDFS